MNAHIVNISVHVIYPALPGKVRVCFTHIIAVVESKRAVYRLKFLLVTRFTGIIGADSKLVLTGGCAEPCVSVF
jgi:hypothetical protein